MARGPCSTRPPRPSSWQQVRSWCQARCLTAGCLRRSRRRGAPMRAAQVPDTEHVVDVDRFPFQRNGTAVSASRKVYDITTHAVSSRKEPLSPQLGRSAADARDLRVFSRHSQERGVADGGLSWPPSAEVSTSTRAGAWAQPRAKGSEPRFLIGGELSNRTRTSSRCTRRRGRLRCERRPREHPRSCLGT